MIPSTIKLLVIAIASTLVTSHPTPEKSSDLHSRNNDGYSIDWDSAIARAQAQVAQMTLGEKVHRCDSREGVTCY